MSLTFVQVHMKLLQGPYTVPNTEVGDGEEEVRDG